MIYLRCLQIALVAGSIPLLIFTAMQDGDLALLKEVAIIGANVLLNIGVNALAQINFGTSDVDVSADTDSDAALV